MFSKIKSEYVLLLIAIIWLFFFSFVLQLSPGFSLVGDDGTYLFAAKKLYLDHQLDDSRPLLINAINGFPLLFGYGDAAVVGWSNVINISCWLLTSLLVFKILAQQFTRRTAFIAAVLFIFCIGNVANAFNVLSEPIFICMLLFAVFCIGKQAKSNNYKYITLALSVLTLAILVKPIAVGLVGIVALFHLKKYKEIIFNKYFALLLVALSLVVFQLYSMKKQYGDYTISYVSSITFYNYLGGKADCLKKNIEFIPGENKRTKHFNQFSTHEQKKISNNDFKEQLQNNTVNLVKAYAFCIYSNSSKGSFIVSECKNENRTSYFDSFHFLFKAVSKVQNIVFTIVGVLLSFFVLLRKKNETVFHQMIAAMIVYIFFISAMSCWQCDRFHIVFFPLVIVLGIAFFDKKRTKIIAKK
ncbi:MAG: glycosyltransferase family 39 protein [Bacteroidota bacterium]